jgi:RNA polymerase sigma-70 factor (ECF subfamily)
MKNEKSNEEALMVAYVAGDRAAFEKLFALLAPRIHWFFKRTFGQEAVADDLMQVTFMKLHAARQQYRPNLALRPWVFTIAARVRLDELRRRRRIPEDGDEDALVRAEEQSVSRGDEVHGSPPNVDHTSMVRSALESLPDSQKTVIYLHRYEGMTFLEIAQVLGSNDGAIRARAFRAYESLRRTLKPLLGDNGEL